MPSAKEQAYPLPLADKEAQAIKSRRAYVQKSEKADAERRVAAEQKAKANDTVNKRAVADRKGKDKAQNSPPPLPSDAFIGIGLSGGGIRSATICLGLFQALAERQMLRQFDFESTVSGGGRTS